MEEQYKIKLKVGKYFKKCLFLIYKLEDNGYFLNILWASKYLKNAVEYVVSMICQRINFYEYLLLW